MLAVLRGKQARHRMAAQGNQLRQGVRTVADRLPGGGQTTVEEGG
jgi:hypothetical protein